MRLIHEDADPMQPLADVLLAYAQEVLTQYDQLALAWRDLPNHWQGNAAEPARDDLRAWLNQAAESSNMAKFLGQQAKQCFESTASQNRIPESMTGDHTGERPLEASPAAVLYDRYGPLILAYLRRHTASLEDAEDVLLDIFVAALEQDQLAAVPEEARVRWLQRVARNKVVDHYRRSARGLTVPLEQGTESLAMDIALAPEQVVLRQEERDHLLRAIHQLPPLQQEVLRLRFVAGLRAAEIASLLNKREEAVRKLLSRTLNLLRSHYSTVTEEQALEHRSGSQVGD